MDRILIIDDELHIRRLIRRLLSRHDYECDEAENAEDGWEKLSNKTYSLVLSDVNMPGTSGLELAPTIARHFPDTPVVMVTGVDDPDVARQAMTCGAYGYIIKPFEPNELLIGVMNALRRRELELENRQHREHLESLVQARTQELRETFAQLERAHGDLEKVQEETIRRLSIAAEYRDEETGAHIQRMSRYCQLLAQLAEIEPEQVELIRLASPLHDIGKIGIPDAILQKPGRHTKEEFDVMKRHAEIGFKILCDTGYPLLDMAGTIAQTHHEKWNGQGYPCGLKGEEIPLVGRICAIADVFDALTTKRVYKPAFSVEDAVGILEEGRDAHFDPELLDIFLGNMDKVLKIRQAFPDESARPPY